MNKKVWAIIFTALVLITSGLGTYYYFSSEDAKTSFTKIEHEWIENNKLKLIDIGVENDIPVFNYIGEGVIFEFFKSFEETTGLEFNRISYSYNDEIKADYSFKISKDVKSNQINVYEDSYVLLTTENVKYSSLNEITKLKIGVLKEDVDDIRTYLKGLNNEITGFDSIKKFDTALALEEGEATIDAILVPKMLMLKYALNSKLHIAYLANDLTVNYVIELGSNERLNTIIQKYYRKWKNEKYEEEFNKYFTNCYFEFSKIDQNAMASFKGKRYTYGYINNAPFDITMSDELYGTNKSILEKFSDVADIEINYKEYSNLDSLLKAFEKNEIDLFFNNTKKSGYDLNSFVSSDAYLKEMVVISNNKSTYGITSVQSLKNKTVAVLKNSNFAGILGTVGAKKIEYNTIEDLVNSKENLIVLDLSTYEYYKNSNFGNYKIEYTEKSDGYGYTMQSVASNTTFNEYLNFYLKLMPQNSIVSNSINEIMQKDSRHNLIKTASLIAGLILVYIASIIFTSQMNKTKQPSVSFKKTEKIKYMDMLTSLKNRNYLNDNIDKWEESKVYPQTIIIIDLNNIAYINDNYGHNAGDEEIKEAANVLIKNQVINSDIIRTNGNEFLIYLVGYKDRQIDTYIKKLNKELKELKHGFGAAIGYSMITDEIKTIDDAINEATIEMRKLKEEANDSKY